jgi:3-dehydroquinate synthase
MRTLTVDIKDQPYPIHIGPGLIDRADLITPHLLQKRVAVITNTTVSPLYAERLRKVLTDAGVESFEIVLPDGEIHKNWQTLNVIFDQLIAKRCERKTTLIALGGGVVGDMTGFAAATYQRGAPYIQIPTTLLAQVDSAVGGKTAINHPQGKNMIGAFYQPKLVLADVDLVNSLPKREFSAGMAEVIKYGLIRDLPFFEWLETNMEPMMARDEDALIHAVFESCRNKAEVVAEDEKETGVRAILNLGHTFGHAIETATGYREWLHGEAVAMGINLAATLSQNLGHLSEQMVARIRQLLIAADLPTLHPDLDGGKFVDLMSHDKKVTSGAMTFVLLRQIGEAYCDSTISHSLLGTTISSCALNSTDNIKVE